MGKQSVLRRLFEDRKHNKHKKTEPKFYIDFEGSSQLTNIHVCECGCPLFEGEKMCPDCLRANPKFDGSY